MRAEDGATGERDLAGGVVLEDAEAAELGEPGAAFLGARRDQLVAGVQLHLAAGPVEVAAGAADGEQVEAGLELELRRR